MLFIYDQRPLRTDLVQGCLCPASVMSAIVVAQRALGCISRSESIGHSRRGRHAGTEPRFRKRCWRSLWILAPTPYLYDRAVALVEADDGESDADALVLRLRSCRALGMRRARAEKQVVENPARLPVKVNGPTRFENQRRSGCRLVLSYASSRGVPRAHCEK